MRTDWDTYFMGLARLAATRATCDRRAVGCVLVAPDRTVLSTGYNGSLPGTPHCDDAGHMLVGGHCARTIHAEQNAVAHLARRGGGALVGCTAYVTTYPCVACAKLLVAAGVVRVVYDAPYHPEQADLVAGLLASAGVALVPAGAGAG